MVSQLDLITNLEEELPQRNRYYGIYYGLVEDNQDPLKLGRLKIRSPFHDDPETIPTGDLPWAHYVTPYGGAKDVGHYFIPPKDAQVAFAFVDGHPWYPVWLGCVYGAPKGESDTLVSRIDPPEEGWDYTKYHSISTPYGHIIEIDDNVVGDNKYTKIRIKTPDDYFLLLSEEKERLELHTRDNRDLLMDDKEETIILSAPDGHYIEISSADSSNFIEIKTEKSNQIRLDDDEKYIVVRTPEKVELLLDEKKHYAHLRGDKNDMALVLDDASGYIGLFNALGSSLGSDGFIRIRYSGSSTRAEMAAGGDAGPVVAVDEGLREAYMSSGGITGDTMVKVGPDVPVIGSRVHLMAGLNSFIMASNPIFPTTMILASPLIIQFLFPNPTCLQFRGPINSNYFAHTHKPGTYQSGGKPVTGSSGPPES